jgi:hypothetical protein
MDFMREGLNEGTIVAAIAVDPDTIGIKNPTDTGYCGTPRGSNIHKRRGERRCGDCANIATGEWNTWAAEKDARDDAERLERAAKLRPSLAVILEAFGVTDTDLAIAALRDHSYGDYADALDLAAAQCPVQVDVKTSGAGIRAWLRGRAMLARKEL